MFSKLEARDVTSDAPIFDLRGGCLKALRVTCRTYVGDLLSACTSNG